MSLSTLEGFGYIFRIKDEAINATYNLTTISRNDSIMEFKINLEGHDNLLNVRLNKNQLGCNKWVKMLFSFHPSTKLLEVNINGEAHQLVNVSISDIFEPQITFGRDNHIVDVLSFSIRNLKVTTDKAQYKFAFKESKGNIVHDAEGNAIGSVENPEWLINSQYYWKHLYTYTSDTESGICYDDKNQCMMFFNSDSISSYHFDYEQIDSYIFKNTCPLELKLGTNFLAQNRLYAYEVHYLRRNNPSVVSFDFTSKEWTVVSKDGLPMQLHHHNGYVDSNFNRYIIFGGFGNNQYNGKFVGFDLIKNEWDTLYLKGEHISPRYFAGLTSFGNSLYVFGGMGNELGDHTIGRRYYYDLHKVDLTQNSIEKKWEIKWTNENIVPVRNMIMLNDSSFYSLCYPEHKSESQLQLYRFSTCCGNFQPLGNSIPICSDKITTNANLYYNTQTNEFYCTVQEFNESSSVSKLYSLSAPPIAFSELHHNGKNTKSTNWLYLLMLILIILSFYISWFLYKKKLGKRILLVKENQKIESSSHEKTNETPKQFPTISLLGEFEVIDAKGINITDQFTPITKLLFIRCLIETIKGRGLTSDEINEEFWQGMDNAKATNNRNVNISKLRSILALLGDVQFTKRNNYWIIEFEDSILCDYQEIEQLLNRNETIEKNNVSSILQLASKGTLLSGIDRDWAEAYKTEYSDLLINQLHFCAKNTKFKNDFKLLIEIADVIFIHDNTDENALKLKCSSLYQLGKKKNAKDCYERFCVNYKDLLNETFGITFEESIQAK